MLVNYSYHLWFKVCKPARKKYKLTVNALLILNACYLYQSVINKPFARYNLQQFVTYYNHVKIRYYVNLLIDKGYIIESGNYKGHPLYSISPEGLQIIKELNENYDKELYLFCNKYNIEL